MTADTNKELKEEIINDLQSAEGKLCVVIATSTLSMGINIKVKFAATSQLFYHDIM